MIQIEQVKEFIVENFLFGDATDFTEDTSFLKTGIIDSLGIMELIAFLEETFQIGIEDHELIPDNLDSLNRIKAFVDKKQNYKSSHNQPK